MAITPSSPALGSGNPNVSGLPATDQRGSGFSRVTNGRLDVGAFQVQASTPTPPSVLLTAITILPVQDGYVFVNELASLVETVTAQVTIAATGQPVNRGTVALNDDGHTAVVPVRGGRATYTFNNANPSPHSISATYTGTGQLGESYATVTVPVADVPPVVLADLELQACILEFFQAIIQDI
jgi:hypothetical protein